MIKRAQASIFGQAVPLLLLILFAYTGTAKAIHPGTLSAQLAQLGLSSGWLKPALAGIPAAEITVALLLAFPRTRIPGLFLATAAMLLFTVYVALVLAGTHRPCTCGGVIAAMNWKQHLLFNSLFLIGSAGSLRWHIILRAYKGVSRKPLTE